MLWKSPIYRFRIPKPNTEDGTLQEIVFDVTGSAPTHDFITDKMRAVFDEILDPNNIGKGIKSVLDFGAGKLKNTPYFLKKDRKTCAVEFEELGKKSGKAKKNLKICQGYKGLFESLIFPYPFIEHRGRYDLAVLINVPSIMPIHSERLMVLQVLHEKINDGKYLLWYAQKEGGYKDIKLTGKFNCGDGIWRGKNKRFKTFFIYNRPDEVDEMMLMSGFELVKKFSVPGNDARLYKKTPYNLLEGILTPELIRKNIPIDKTIKNPADVAPKVVKQTGKIKIVSPNPPKLAVENLYISALNSLKRGKKPYHYQRLAALIISRIFRKSLRNMKIEQKQYGGIKKIDTIFSNYAENGFFKNLVGIQNVKCPYVIVESKDLSFDPNNPEFDQVGGRLGGDIGNFGILVCRDIGNERAASKRCEDFLTKGKYIIFLSDSDLLEMLEHSINGDIQEIDNIMDIKLRQLILRENA